MQHRRLRLGIGKVLETWVNPVSGVGVAMLSLRVRWIVGDYGSLLHSSLLLGQVGWPRYRCVRVTGGLVSLATDVGTGF